MQPQAKALTRATPAEVSPTTRREPLVPESLKRFLKYLKRYPAMLCFAVLAGVAKLVLQFAFPAIFGFVVNEVIVVEGDSTMTDAERGDWLFRLTIITLVVIGLYGVATFFRSYLTGQIAFRIIRDIRQDLFGHLHRLSLHFYSKERTGSIVSRVITDISQASQLVNGGVVAVVMDLGAFVFGIGLLLWISPPLTLLALAILPLYGFLINKLRPRVRHAGRLVQRSIGKISGNVQEQLAGIALVQSSAAEDRESDRFRNDTEEHYDRVVQQKVLAAFTETLGETLTRGGTALVVLLGGYLSYKHGTVNAGELVMFIGWLAVMYFPVQRFAEINVVFQTCMVSIERVFRVFDITPKILERPGAYPHPPERGDVVFENVRFSYSDDSDESRTSLGHEDDKGSVDPVTGKEVGVRGKDRPNLVTLSSRERRRLVRYELAQQMKLERRRKQLARTGKLPGPPPVQRRWVLDGLSFEVPAGQRVALVGPSGSGKTTLVSLLPRLYDVSEGAIRIDGRDVRDYAKKPLREAVGIVQQDSFLFSGTVYDNLMYGKPEATREQVEQAARDANAYEFIMKLEGGFESQLGERGVNLSGGQRQRLSIARAILKDARILILDEATSALDVESERLVQEALERLMRGRTSFIIAHRLSTVRDADRILVIADGRVVEDGTHDTLVAANGLYATLARQAFKEPGVS
jgi:ABC-type multidrug transport system fused ATPase/permease subunit